MAAKKTGGTGTRTKAKNQAMAAAMKIQGVKRSICRCPICHGLVGIERIYAHILNCKN
jgi:hypothetical protein